MNIINKLQTEPISIAYFSMEIGLEPNIPTYSGGLGVLAGDTLRAAADLGIPMVGVTPIHRKGYFNQGLDEQGNQTEKPVEWFPQNFLEALPHRAMVEIEGRHVYIRPWRYIIQGITGHAVPIYFLDTALPENNPADRSFTDYLYGGDERYRLCQEVILGLGGVAILQALGYNNVQTYHMNEGHSALLALALLQMHIPKVDAGAVSEDDWQLIRKKCVFTTHTPVPAGHDKFSRDLVRRIIGDRYTSMLESGGCFLDGVLNMTHLGLVSSHYINGVSMRHEEISRNMFPEYPINSITNGVHAVTWTSEPFSALYDRRIPEWRHDNLNLRYAISISIDEISRVHAEAKDQLLKEVEFARGIKLQPNILTIGFARRATAYKRAELLFSDLNRLRKIAREAGPLQIIYSGKAHPHDESGKQIIRSIYKAAADLKGEITVVYLENYDMALAKIVCSGVDLWLNTPQRPYEASGTSGMKAALNGVPSLSVLDGWWIEGCVENITGWAIGDGWNVDSDRSREIASLYDKLEYSIVPMYYKQPGEYAKIMRSAISINGSFYNAERMVFQYLANAYS